MTRAHWRYALLEQGAIASVVNILINGGIASVAYRGLTAVPLWGPQGMSGDLLCTCFLLPFITSLIVTRLARGEVRRGRFAQLESKGLLARMPHSVRLRSIVWGVVVLAVVGPLAVGGLVLSGVTEIETRQFVIAKALFAAVLAALVTPLITIAALHDPPATR